MEREYFLFYFLFAKNVAGQPNCLELFCFFLFLSLSPVKVNESFRISYDFFLSPATRLLISFDEVPSSGVNADKVARASLENINK